MARKAAEVERQASYALDMEETHARLIEELAKVCRDYCNVTWDEALNVAGVPLDSAWRQLGSIYYHPDIRKIPGAILPPSALVLEASKQALATQTALPLPTASKGPRQAGDQRQGANRAKDKCKGKGAKPPSEDKNAAKAMEAEAKAKEAEAKTKEVDPKAKDAPTSQLS